MTLQLPHIVRIPTGPYQANCYLAHLEAESSCLVVDPGAEPERICAEIVARGLQPKAILVTHGHCDHVGAVAGVARTSGAPVYIAEGEASMLSSLETRGWPQFGPWESHDPEETLVGGESLELAGMSLSVLSVPGHSVAHLAFSGHGVVFSGDVLFAGSVGRTDLEDGDWPTLERSIASLIDALAPETFVLCGHGEPTTLGHERETNPVLESLR